MVVEGDRDELRRLAQRAARGKRSSAETAGLLVDLDAELLFGR